MVYANQRALQSRGLTLMDVVHALYRSNLIIPAGDAKIGATDFFVYTNSMITNPENISEVPVKVAGPGDRPVFVGDIGHAEDAAQIQPNIVRINGQRSVYVPVLKQSRANTIAIVDGIESLLPHISGIPKALKLKAIFSQATYVRDAV